MKKFIICALALIGAISCQNDQLSKEASTGEHSVTFNANFEGGTKTALLVKVFPSWRNTSNEDVYLYENTTAGTNCQIIVDDTDYEHATFKATFNTKKAETYSYGGLVAQSSDGTTFVVPELQKPDNDCLIDPKADFLIGNSGNTFSEPQEDLFLFFSRPVALSRLAITNMEGEKVMSVKITSTDKLTGSTSLDKIDFESKSAEFNTESGSTEITLSYGEEGSANKGTFYAYFISLPGKKNISSVEVTTDKYIYTKTIGKATTFSANEFKNIALDLTVGGNVTRKAVGAKYYVKVAGNEIVNGTYLIVAADGSEYYAFNANTKSSYRTLVTIANDKIEATDALKEAEVEITANSGKYFLKTSEGYVYSSSGTITFNSSQNDKYLHTGTMSSGTASFTNKPSSTTYNFRYSPSNDKFQYSSSNSSSLSLYLLEGSSKTARNLTFAESAVAKYTTDAPFTNTLSGVTDGVTYTSSSNSVATVSTTGEVTIQGAGYATITASAPENTTYRAETVSYSLTVSIEGAFNLENSKVKAYFDDATTSYTDDNYTSKTVVETYSSSQSSTNRLDAPAPVSLSWTSSASGTRTVYVYNNSTMTELEMSTTTSGNSVEIYNLIPNKTYYYKVTASSTTVTTGNFSTEGRRRMIKVSGTYGRGHANNCRDFGGLKTTNGKTLKYGVLFRGTTMDATTTSEKEYLTGYMNIGLDIDLREGTTSGTPGSDGSEYAYNAFNGSYGVEYVKGNFTGNISSFYTTSSNAKTNMTNIFTKILAAINSGKATYIHCWSGADRTGYVSILLAAVLGVSPKDCSIDFELTSFSVVGLRTRTGQGHALGKDGLNYINNYSKGSTFQEKAYNILLDYGITDAQITEFRNAMLQ